MADESSIPVKRYRYSDAPAAAPGGAQVAAAAAPELAASGEFPAALIWAMLGTAAVVGVFYSANLVNLVQRWTHDAGWSHGFVVPLISLFFVRIKWDELRALKPSGSMVGMLVILVAVCGQVVFRATGLDEMSRVSLPVLLFGLVLFILGWDYLKILWLPIGFLVFALPPPQTLYVQMTTPMQSIAAELGVDLLPLFGGEGVRHGTTIDVIYGGVTKQLDIAYACSGMRLLVAFFALAVALGYSTARPMWQKVTLAVCALPIAILCNGLRVTCTGVLVSKVGPEWGEGDAHGFFGMTMLLPALLLQLGVAWALDRMFIETPDSPGEGKVQS